MSGSAVLRILRVVAIGGLLIGCGGSPDLVATGGQPGNGVGGGGTNNSPPQCSGDECRLGKFSQPAGETTIMGMVTDEKCININGKKACKPAAGSLALLRDDRILYFNALEGTENIQTSIVMEFGLDGVSVNDQTRIMTIADDDSLSFVTPTPVDGGANPDGNDSLLVNPSNDASSTASNDGALFCSDLIQLYDGRIMATGGTDYYTEGGAVELEGLKNSRIFDPGANTWAQAASMTFGRWYPTMVTLANGDIFVASGVTKLLKPFYNDRPSVDSGRNVAQTETYDLGCDRWDLNPSTADKSLPLYPRLHLLPNGHVLYNAAGQAFNPFGQGYDQALWNIVSSYDPANQTWTDLAYAGMPNIPLATAQPVLAAMGSPPDPNDFAQLRQARIDEINAASGPGFTPPAPPSAGDLAAQLIALGASPPSDDQARVAGFRGSTHSIMLTLEPDAEGDYNVARFLTAGGVLGDINNASPGSYMPTAHSRIDTITVTEAGLSYDSTTTGPLGRPRWYGTGVLLPDATVMVFSGSDRDEVVTPGVGNPIRITERFDPATNQWTDMGTQINKRTYHNTELLLPDGRVLIGGHAPIPYNYTANVPPGDPRATASPNDGRDPTFEIYSPPYVFKDRPSITSAASQVSAGQQLTINTPEASDVVSVVLIRRTVMTHVIDGDQRAVRLPIISQVNNTLTVQIPTAQAVLPPGHYLLFINTADSDGLVPSTSAAVQVLGAELGCNG